MNDSDVHTCNLAEAGSWVPGTALVAEHLANPPDGSITALHYHQVAGLDLQEPGEKGLTQGHDGLRRHAAGDGLHQEAVLTYFRHHARDGRCQRVAAKD